MNIKNFKNVRRSSYVERLHTVPTIGNQNLGHHCYNVCLIALLITRGQLDVRLLKACLFHDAHEIGIGDWPSPATRFDSAIKRAKDDYVTAFNIIYDLHIELTMEEQNILSWSDKAELAYYCIDQICMGNINAKEILRRVYSYMQDMTHVGETENLLLDINESMRLLGVQPND